MKAYILKKIGQLEYTDVPIPSLQSGWALIQVDAAGICGSDIPRIFSTGTFHIVCCCRLRIFYMELMEKCLPVCQSKSCPVRQIHLQLCLKIRVPEW